MAESPAHKGLLPTTHWSVLLAARATDAPQAGEALETLCRSYWYPLYAFVRRQGQTPEDAQDLTQAFFAHLLRKDFLSGVRPANGRFRSFLLVCLKHFLADEWEKAHTAKRGGFDSACFPDVEHAEDRYRQEGRTEANPESLYERRWALDLLGRDVFPRWPLPRHRRQGSDRQALERACRA